MSSLREQTLSRLRPYQAEVVLATEGSPKGKIILPTGAGKTWCQVAQIALDIARHPGEFRTYVCVAPRIVLTYQLLKEYYSFLTLAGVEARYMFVHSGGKADEQELEDIRIQAWIDGNTIPYAEIANTCAVPPIREVWDRAQEQALPLITLTTYNSYHKVEQAARDSKRPIHIALCDEAHHLVTEVFHEDVLSIMSAERRYFYTATERKTRSSSGLGMNNYEMFGPTIKSMTPREAIELGILMPPRLHFVKPEGGVGYSTADYDKSRSRIIREAFLQHRTQLKIAPKLLVATGGTQDIKDFLNSGECGELRDGGVNVFAIASHDDVGNYVNGENVTRQEFLKQIKRVGAEEEAEVLVLHYDILTEGIDIPGFTGVMLMRSMNITKFRQTFGRAARITPRDRRELETGRVKVGEHKALEKPFAFIVVPYITQEHEDDRANITDLVNELRYFVINPAETVVSTCLVNGVPEEEPLEALNDIHTKIPAVGKLIEKLEAEIERERIISLPTEEWIEYNRESIGSIAEIYR